ncbi:CopG family ribbon-helix-helix protein [Sphingomonas profundi]|uniref:CopG family ribbon-helix-helix protein n=1 Tax=Alterirhizorhabdus profundi TaxID=2681549 RepID=UPI0012E93E15|nr:ribbon-helix-helix protein, CopG family [Sphingomonas profundi]
MTKSAIITARVDAETLALVDRIAKSQGRSRAWFAAQAIERAAEQETAYLAFVQEGIDAADRGELIPHEEVFREIRARRSRCAER